VPAEVLQRLEVHPVGDVREVLRLALEPAAGSAAPETAAVPEAA
jgi:ATP-dependent Lon protease